MQSLYDELSIEIFKHIKTPISLIVTNRQWYLISQDCHTRAEWLIYKYGRAHALFHAVRLGNSFTTGEVIQALLSRNAIFPRYFVQRLLMHFGTYDEKLIQLKVEHNVNQIDSNRLRALQKKLCTPWGSNISLSIFTKLMTEGFKILNDDELATKGNDMELFHFLSAGPLVINQAPQKLHQNLDLIKDLILKEKFVPFPPRPKPKYEDTVEYIQLMQTRAHEEYPPKDGYENSRQLNVVARAILIHPDLVSLWKEIGYYEICHDVNELVIQGAFLIFFPPSPSNNWVCPDVDTIVIRLEHLINLGFQLTDDVMEEVLHLFEHRLNEIGDLLMESFQVIRKESKSSIACSCLIYAIKPERNLKKADLLEFLIDRIDQPKEALENALDYYKVGFRLNIESIKTTKEIRSLTVNSNLYYWILKNYGPNSEITQTCFDDIIESRIWIDLKLQETPERKVPENLTSCAFNSICFIYLEFCNERVLFQINHFQYLQLVDNDEIINPFFKISLPIVFGLQLKEKLPLKIVYEYDRPEIKLNDTAQNNHKRKFDEMNNQPNITKNWFDLLQRTYEQIHVNNSDIKENFNKKFGNFWQKSINDINIDNIDKQNSLKKLKQ